MLSEQNVYKIHFIIQVSNCFERGDIVLGAKILGL